jgi:hypothetical protein
VACAGRRPRRSWSGRLKAACKPCEQRNLRASGGEGDADACGGLGYPRGNFDQTEPQGRELGNGEGLRSGNRVTQRKQEPKGTGVQHEANLVGQRRATTGAVRGELRLVPLDEVLYLAARAGPPSTLSDAWS